VSARVQQLLQIADDELILGSVMAQTAKVVVAKREERFAGSLPLVHLCGAAITCELLRQEGLGPIAPAQRSTAAAPAL
jgi:hypothetical protein